MDEKSVIKTVPKCKNILGSEMDQGPNKPSIALVNGCCSSMLKGIPSHIHKSYLKDMYFCPDHNYSLENLKNFFIWEKEVKN